MAITTLKLATSGMHCGSCAMLIDMTVGDLDGVETVKTDHAVGETVLTYDSELLTPEQVIAAIRSAGYEADVIA